MAFDGSEIQDSTRPTTTRAPRPLPRKAASEKARRRRKARVDRDNEFWNDFMIIDRDGDGYISAAELARAVSTPMAQARALIEQADADRNKLVDFGEFRRAQPA